MAHKGLRKHLFLHLLVHVDWARTGEIWQLEEINADGLV